MSWADGRRYEGEWLDGKCTGRGVTTFANGSRYEGVYLEDKMHGYGEEWLLPENIFFVL
jgi:hypothetical protein